MTEIEILDSLNHPHVIKYEQQLIRLINLSFMN